MKDELEKCQCTEMLDGCGRCVWGKPHELKEFEII